MNYWSLFLVILPVWAVIGNILVIFSVYKEKSLHNLTNYLVVNLAIADIMVALFAMPFHIYVSVNGMWSLGNTFCDISLSIDSCTAIVSKFTLVAISVDRYIAVLKPVQYRSLSVQYKPINRFLLIAFFIWMFSLAIALPFLFGLNSLPERVSSICTFYNSHYSMGASIFTFWIPSLVLVFMYTKIIRAIRQRARRLSKNHDTQNVVQVHNDQDISQISGEIERTSNECSMKRPDCRTTITIGIVLAVFFICWAPFYGSLVAQFVYFEINKSNHQDKCHHICLWQHIYFYTGWVGYFNSCLNMVIYAFFNPQFKDAFKKHFISLLRR